jgi:hypothetical protein
LRECDLKTRLWRRLPGVAEPHAHTILRCSLDDRFEFIAAPVEHANGGPRAQSQDASQVFCFLFRKRDQFAGRLCLRREETRVHANEL